MRFAVVVNRRLDKSMEITDRIVALLEKEHSVETDTLSRERVRAGEGDHGNPDVVITVGGDGTILSALNHYDSKILGIDIGQVGFLTEVPPDKIEEAIKRVLAGDYLIDKRKRIRPVFNGEIQPDCLNEMVIHSSQVSKMQEFEVSIEDERIMKVRADGVIVSTPTGSTCYSMSAGGPILDPRVEAFIVQPIAPYKLSARPFVVPAERKLVVEVLRDRPCSLVFDGQSGVDMNVGDRVEATVSPNPAEFIRFGKSFYSQIQRKLEKI